MTQTKKHSLLEAITNTAVGFVISLGSTFIIFPLVGVPSSAGKNLLITLFFTVISILRGYILRRFFNRQSQKVTQPKHPGLCCYKNCNEPIYNLGHCFHHWCLANQDC